jgi:cleavage and polyadenylation specificity factor subunit 1
VLETGDTLGEVTESVEYYTEGGTIIAGNLFGRHCVVQVFDRGLRLLDGAIQMQELLIERPEAETNGSVPSTGNLVVGAAIADPFVVLKMADGALQLVVGDPATSTMTISSPSSFASNTDLITAFSLYQDKGPYCWLRRACKDSSERSQLSTAPDQGKVFCVICRQTGRLEIYELPHVTCVFSVENFNYGMSVLWDNKVSEKRVSSNAALRDGAEEDETAGEDMLRDTASQLLVTQVCFERWGEKFGRPFLLATLSDGTMLCYHAFCYEVPETGDALEYADSIGRGNAKETPRLGNLRFVRMPIDWVSGEDEGVGEKNPTLQFYPFRNVGSMSGVFVTGSRPAWLMICRQRIRCHPQFCDGAILGFTPLHNVNCTHGFIYVTAEGLLKICQLPSLLFYDNDWAVQKIPLRGTPHQVTYHPDVNLYALIMSTPSSWSASQVMAGEASSGNYTDQQTEESLAEDGQKLVTSEEFEVRIIEPAQPGSDWETKASIKMHMTENALTVRIVNIRVGLSVCLPLYVPVCSVYLNIIVLMTWRQMRTLPLFETFL